MIKFKFFSTKTDRTKAVNPVCGLDVIKKYEDFFQKKKTKHKGLALLKSSGITYYLSNFFTRGLMFKKIIYIGVIVFFLVSLSVFPNKKAGQNKIMGLWFTEFKNVKSILLFQKIDGKENIKQLIGIDSNGGFDNYSFKIQKGKILFEFEGKTKSNSISFDNNNIMYYKPYGTNLSMVLRRINNPALVSEGINFIKRNKNLLEGKNITNKERKDLGKKIKKMISWNKMSMSQGEYLGWIKKKQKIEWKKTINESEERKKFSRKFIVDTQNLNKITGKWLFNGKLTFIFTKTLVCEIFGVKLYRLKTENNPANKDIDLTYTILINKDDKRSYITLVYWQFEFQRPSRIEFKNKDKFITFSNDEVDAEAVRIK